MLMTQLQLFPGGGDALGVRGVKLVSRSSATSCSAR